MSLKRKIPILYLVTGLGAGGAERVVFDLSRKIPKESFNVFVISLSKKDKLLDMFIKQGIDVQALNMSKTPLSLIKTVFSLSKFIRQNKIKIIHCHMTHAMIISTLLKITNWNIKIVFTSHSVKFGSKLRELIIFVLKPLRSVDILFSKSMIKYYYKKKYRIIPNGINLSHNEIKYPKYKKFTLIAVGRLEEAKNHIGLIEIVGKLKTKIDFNLIIAGDGELREMLTDKIKEKRLKNYISLVGYKNNISKLLNRSHLFVISSKWEGMPISLLEAAAVGLPVLSTPVGSIPAIINEQTGFLSKLNFFPEKIYFIYQHYGEALNRALTLKKTVEENYYLDKVVTKHANLYLSLVK